MPEVRLTTLPVLRRYSLALRQEWADAETLLEALEDSIAQVTRALGGPEGSHRDTRSGAVGVAGPPPHRDERLREESEAQA